MDSVKFLKGLHFGGPWTIASDKNWAGVTFSDLRSAVEIIHKANKAGRNIYALGNTRIEGRTTRRKVDMIHAQGMWLDIDDCGFDEELLWELKKLEPTCAVFSGGGLQAFWRFDEPVSWQDGEAINRWWLRQNAHLKPDTACYTADHVWRVPGTINWPNKKKRAKGRIPTMARLVHADWEQTVDPDILGRNPANERVFRQVKVVEWHGPTDTLFIAEVLPPWAFRMLFNQTDKDGQPFASRSHWYWAFIGACVRQEVADELIAWCLTNPKFPISDGLLNPVNADRNYEPLAEAYRQIARMGDG